MARVHSINSMLGLEAVVMVADAAVAVGDAREVGNIGGKAPGLCSTALTPIMSARTMGPKVTQGILRLLRQGVAV